MKLLILFLLISHTGIPFGEMSKKLSDVWKSMPEEKKRRYVELCRQEQEAGNVCYLT